MQTTMPASQPSTSTSGNNSQPQPTFKTVETLARHCVKLEGFDREKAAKRMINMLASDPVLWGALVEPLCQRACNEAAAEHIRQRRASFFPTTSIPQTLPKGHQTPQSKALHQIGQSVFDELMIPTKSGGVKFGKATREDLQEAAEIYRKNISTNKQRLDFVLNTLKKIKPGKMVDQCISLREANKLLGRLKINP